MKYQNLSPKKIANKFQQNFSALEGVFVFKVGEFCDKIGLNLKFVKLDKGKSGYFDLKLLIKLIIMLQECSQSRFDEYHKYTPDELTREKEANNFAGELLMPEYKFKEFFDEVRGDIRKLADRFGVSTRATEVRAFWLGLIDNI